MNEENNFNALLFHRAYVFFVFFFFFSSPSSPYLMIIITYYDNKIIKKYFLHHRLHWGHRRRRSRLPRLFRNNAKQHIFRMNFISQYYFILFFFFSLFLMELLFRYERQKCRFLPCQPHNTLIDERCSQKKRKRKKIQQYL